MAKKKEKQKDTIKITQEPHQFPFPLGEQGKAEVANKLAAAIQQLESIEGQKKAADAGFNGQMKSIQQQIHTLSYKVINNEEMRSIVCDLQLNYTKQTATLIRTDTNEVVQERPMTDEEKQMDLDFDGTE